MHNLQFTEDDKEHPSTLSLWVNRDNKLYIEMYQDPSDPYSFQNIVLDLDDAKMLANELTRLARMIESNEQEQGKDPEWLQREKTAKQLMFSR